MATFFDSKEEVIDFQLTAHGKDLLSKGRFKPMYYSFLDEGVLYDQNYSGISSETQSNIQARIQDQTPTVKVFNTFPVETKLKKKAITLEDNFYSQFYSLSNTSINYDYYPSWNIVCLKNTFVSSSNYITGTGGVIYPIPQISLSCSYTDKIMLDTVYLQSKNSITGSDDTITSELSIGGFLSTDGISITSLQKKSEEEKKFNTFITSEHFEDGSIIVVEEDEIIIDITQNNSALDEEYEIEVYKYDLDQNGNEIILPLNFFFKEHEMVVDDILIDIKDNYSTLPIDKNVVEFYMNIKLDSQIDQTLVCNIIAPKTKGTGVNNTVKCKQTFDTSNSTSPLYRQDNIGDGVTVC